MNVPTVIVLVVVAALVVLAVRAALKPKGGGHCAGCGSDTCAGTPDEGACPMARRAMAVVEAKLGPVERSNDDEG